MTDTDDEQPIPPFVPTPNRAPGLSFRVGDRVVKNPATWMPSEFDGWGAGLGVGVVADPPWEDPGVLEYGMFLGGGTTDDECVPCVDVRWPAGRAVQRCDELLPAPPVEDRP